MAKTSRTQSETADLRQRHVVRQVAPPYSVWQRFPLWHIESNLNENFKVTQNPEFLSEHPQNWITGSFCHSRHSQKISERSVHNFFVHNFLSYLADTQTNKVWQKHYFLGGGNNIFWAVWRTFDTSHRTVIVVCLWSNVVIVSHAQCLPIFVKTCLLFHFNIHPLFINRKHSPKFFLCTVTNFNIINLSGDGVYKLYTSVIL